MAIMGAKLGWRLPCLDLLRAGRPTNAWRSYTALTDVTVDVKSESKSGNVTEKPLESSKRRSKYATKYTPEEIDQIRKLRDDGMTAHAMAANFPGRSAKGLRWFMDHCLLGSGSPVVQGRRAWSLDEMQELLAMCQRGAPMQEIYEKFPSRSHASVMLKQKDARTLLAASRESDSAIQIMYRPKPWTAEETTLLYELAKQGLSIPQVAVKLGRSHTSVRHHYRKKLRDKIPSWPSSNMWKSQEDIELTRLKASGCTTDESAKILHRSYGSVNARWEAIRPRSADGSALKTRNSRPKFSDTGFSHVAHMRKSGAS